jgi:hypothetical protein
MTAYVGSGALNKHPCGYVFTILKEYVAPAIGDIVLYLSSRRIVVIPLMLFPKVIPHCTIVTSLNSRSDNSSNVVPSGIFPPANSLATFLTSHLRKYSWKINGARTDGISHIPL